MTRCDIHNLIWEIILNFEGSELCLIKVFKLHSNQSSLHMILLCDTGPYRLNHPLFETWESTVIAMYSFNK